MTLAINPSVLWILGTLFIVLSIATGVTRQLKQEDKNRNELIQRVKSWWIIVGLFSLALVMGTSASIWLFAFVSYLALKEFLTIIPTRRSDRRPLFWAYLAIPLQYYWVSMGWYGMFIIFIPVYMFLLIPLRKVLIGETDDFLRSVGTIHWGLMATVFSLSHAAYLLALPESQNATAGPGLLLFLILLTQLNDIFQYLWGKSLGQTKIMPTVSPGKTWAGVIGGVFSTTLVSVLLAPWLTPFNTTEAIFAGAIIGLFGFFGDVTISAIKRDIGVKDCGSLLPGHGGILDRVDSLTYTAPLFFHYLYYLHY